MYIDEASPNSDSRRKVYVTNVYQLVSCAKKWFSSCPIQPKPRLRWACRDAGSSPATPRLWPTPSDVRVKSGAVWSGWCWVGLYDNRDITGLTCCSKTQVALACAYWLQDEHPEVSVFWVHASSAERFRQAYAFIAQECGVPGYDDIQTDVLPLVKTWLQRTERGRWLMIIDNADDAQLFSWPGNLGQWIPECPHGAVLVTTRNKAAGLRLIRSGRLIEVGRDGRGRVHTAAARETQLG